MSQQPRRVQAASLIRRRAKMASSRERRNSRGFVSTSRPELPRDIQAMLFVQPLDQAYTSPLVARQLNNRKDAVTRR